ncbi:MAG: hypothetical protein WBE58_06250, partial [Verrucomicrobiales bacterium]
MSVNVMGGTLGAFVKDATVDVATGGLAITATDRTGLDATSDLGISSSHVDLGQPGGPAFGFTVSANAVGYDLGDIPALTFGALLGTGFGTVNTSEVQAYLVDSIVTVGGDVIVQAVSGVLLNSTVSNTVAPGFGSSARGALGGITQAEAEGALEMIEIAKAVYSSPGVPEASTASYERIDPSEVPGLILEDATSGFAAGLFRKTDGSGEVILAFRGSEIIANDWVTNVYQGSGLLPDQYQFATDLALAAQALYGASLVHITGHSLGGALATTAALTTGIETTVFNAGGLSFGVLDNIEVSVGSAAFAANRDKITNINVAGEFLSDLNGTRDPETIGGIQQGRVVWIPAVDPLSDPLTRHLGNTIVDALEDIIANGGMEISNPAGLTDYYDPPSGSATNASAAALATNVVNAGAKAWIRDTTAGGSDALSAGGTVTVSAEDDIQVYANVKVTSTASQSSDDGGKILFDEMARAVVSDFSQGDGLRTIAFGDTVLVPDVEHDYTVTDGERPIVQGTRVLVDDPDFDSNHGQVGSIYEYVGVGDTLDLSVEDFTRPGYWKLVDSKEGQIFQFMGTEEERDLRIQDYSDTDYWKLLPEEKLFALFEDVTADEEDLPKSGSNTFAAIAVRNDVIGGAQASIENMAVTAAAVTVRAAENALLVANTDVTGTLTDDSAGAGLAAGGAIATNSMQSSAFAFVTGGSLLATGADGIVIEAENASRMEATTQSAISGGSTGVGVVMAFNTVGYEASNIFSQTVDAIIGSTLTPANPSGVHAYLQDASISSLGGVTVSADNVAAIEATLTNLTTSAGESDSIAASAMVATNLVHSGATSYIDFSSANGQVSAAGDVVVVATDEAFLEANTTLEATATFLAEEAEPDPLAEIAGILVDSYAFTTKSGIVPLLLPGIGVLVASDYDPVKGARGKIYRFLGLSGSLTDIDLSTEDYAGQPLRWDLQTIDNALATEIIDFFRDQEDPDEPTTSGTAVGGLIVRNDVQSGAQAWVNHAVANVGSLSVMATESSALIADTSGIVKVEDGATAGSTSINGVIVTNQLQGGADARVTSSQVTTTVDGVTVDASNSAMLDATNTMEAVSTGTSVGVMLAFNTLGYDSKDILTGTIDTLLTTNINGGAGSKATASLVDVPIDAAGDVVVNSANEIVFNATLSNATTGGGTAAGVVISSNMVKGGAESSVLTTAGTQTIAAGGEIQVTATDAAEVHANTKLVSSSVIEGESGDGGVDPLTGLVRALEFDYVTTDGLISVDFGTTVTVAEGHEAGGTEGEVYRFIGTEPTDLSLQGTDFTDSASWELVAVPTGESDYQSSDGGVPVRFGMTVRLDADHEAGGDPGETYRYLGGTETVVIDLATTDFSDLGYWKPVTTSAVIGAVSSLLEEKTAEDKGAAPEPESSTAVGILVVRNDATSGALARVENTHLDATNVEVSASEEMTFTAETNSDVKAQGGTSEVEGDLQSDSIAINGVIATNTIQAEADAHILNGSVTVSGDLTVAASNTSEVEASTNAVVEGDGTSVGAVLAFNTLGYESQNILTQTIDALVGSTIGNANPAKVKAYIQDATINAGGDVSVTGNNSASLTATLGNAASSASTADGVSASGMIGMNRVSSGAEAYIDFTGPGKGTVTAGGTLTVEAQDAAALQSTATFSAISTLASEPGDPDPKHIIGSAFAESYSFTTNSGIRTISLGEGVRVASGFDPFLGVAGKIYRYVGLLPATVDLGAVNYAA